MPESALLVAAAWGYGLPLLGLLGGAALALVLARSLALAADPATFLGAALGTSLALLLSKRLAPTPVLRVHPCLTGGSATSASSE